MSVTMANAQHLLSSHLLLKRKNRHTVATRSAVYHQLTTRFWCTSSTDLNLDICSFRETVTLRSLPSLHLCFWEEDGEAQEGGKKDSWRQWQKPVCTFKSKERRCSRCWVGREKSGGLAVQEDSRRHSAWNIWLKGPGHELNRNLVDLYGTRTSRSK